MEQKKVYLKTIEEVSDALAAGKVVFCDAIKTKYYKDKNNLIIGESEEFGDYVGDFVEMHYSPYILEPKPLEVKPFHLYKDGCGNRILIRHKLNIEVPYPFVGVGFEAYGCYYYTKKGKCWDGKKKNNLVKELADLSKYFEKGDENAKND